MNEREVRDIALEEIIPNRFQPRELFNEEALNELAQSIKEHGVIQPIIVRPVGDKYEIIAGERRYKASELAGKTTVPCIVRQLDDVQSSKVALLENLQRKDLTPIEEARTYQLILKLGSMTQDELAKSIGKSQSAIANKMRLLNLDEEVQTALLSEQISERHARSLLNVEKKEDQKRLLDTIINTRMTVKELDDEIAKIKNINSITNQTIPTPENNINSNVSSFGIANPNQEYASNNINIDPNDIKNSASDINPQNNFVDFNNLLKTNIPETEQQPTMTNRFIPNINYNQMDYQQENSNQQSTGNQQGESNLISNETGEEPQTEFIDDITKTPLQQEVNQILSNTIPNEEPIETLNYDRVDTEPLGLINSSNSLYTNPNTVYDIRFAINNIRQAVQSTEKYGFAISTEEFDYENIYQIVIKIDKNK